MHIPGVASDNVPFLDLITPHLELEQELTGVFLRSLRTGAFIGGPVVEEFERAFATFCNVSHSIAVSSGTDALRFAILASGVQPGDAVVTVPNTFIATAEAISQAGATPEFVDIDHRTYNISIEALRKFLECHCARGKSGRLASLRSGRPVTAVVPVHLYGQMADMDAILALAEEYDLAVIEDACQAHGAEYFSRRLNRWMKAGSMGCAAAFSFYPGKNLGACGEAGAVTTNDSKVVEKIKMLRDHGQIRKYHHDMEGYNGRLDAIQAGILLTKLPLLESWNQLRRDRAAEYNRLLEENEAIIIPYESSCSNAVYHLYVIRTKDREDLMNHLKSAGIGTGLHYPVPLHLQKAYASLGYSHGDFPETERAATEIISLPMFPQLTVRQQTKVAEEIQAFSSKSFAKPPKGEEDPLATEKEQDRLSFSSKSRN